MSVRDLHDATGTPTPWELGDISECGEAVVVGPPGSLSASRYYSSHDARQIICAITMNDPENSEELMRVQIDARRIIAAVNFTQNLPLEMLEGMAEEPLSPPASRDD